MKSKIIKAEIMTKETCEWLIKRKRGSSIEPYFIMYSSVFEPNFSVFMFLLVSIYGVPYAE